MARWGDIEDALGVKVYFCDPRSPLAAPHQRVQTIRPARDAGCPKRRADSSTSTPGAAIAIDRATRSSELRHCAILASSTDSALQTPTSVYA